MENKDLVVFELVTNLRDCHSILQTWTKDLKSIRIRLPDRKFISCAGRLESESPLSIQLESAQTIENIEETEAHFVILGQAFYIPCKVIHGQSKTAIVPTEKIFRQQKRSSYRLKLLDGYSANFQIKKVNGIAVKLDAKIVDFNETGIGLQLDSSADINTGMTIMGSLHCGQHEPLELDGIVRFAGLLANGKFSVGLQLKHQSLGSESDLYALIAKVRVDLFYMS